MPVLNWDDVTSKALLDQVFGLHAVEWLCARGGLRRAFMCNGSVLNESCTRQACAATHTLPGTQLSQQQARLGTLHSSEPFMRVPRV